MAFLSITYTFANGETVDHAKFNQNFTDIRNSLVDGTKDININDATINGTATFVSGLETSGYAFPMGTGNDGDVLTSDGSGLAAWEPANLTVYDIVSCTSSYSALTSDQTILVDTSSTAWTLALPGAASNTGKTYHIKKTTNDFNVCTVDPEAGETIDGRSTFKVVTQYEDLKVISNGSNWNILHHGYDRSWRSNVASCNLQGVSCTQSWSRDSNYLIGKAKFIVTSSQATQTSANTTVPYAYDNVAFNLPSGLTINTAQLLYPGGVTFTTQPAMFDTVGHGMADIQGWGRLPVYGMIVGDIHGDNNIFLDRVGITLLTTSMATSTEFVERQGFWNIGVPQTMLSNTIVVLEYKVPIVNWES